MAEKLIGDRKDIKRIPTYIEGLDEQMEGGVPQGHITLICGTAGTMKSSLSFSILYNEVLLRNKIALYISLEQSSSSIINHMVNMGYAMSKLNLVILTDISSINEKIEKISASKKGALILTDIAAIRKEIKSTNVGSGGDWLNVIKNIAKKVKDKSGCDLFVLDSLQALYVLANLENPRQELFYFFEFLRDLEVTSYLISEMPLNKSRYGVFEVEDFLCDAIIRIDLVERQRKVTREIAIVKMRSTKANVDVFSLEIENGKFKALYGGQPALI